MTLSLTEMERVCPSFQRGEIVTDDAITKSAQKKGEAVGCLLSRGTITVGSVVTSAINEAFESVWCDPAPAVMPD